MGNLYPRVYSVRLNRGYRAHLRKTSDQPGWEACSVGNHKVMGMADDIELTTMERVNVQRGFRRHRVGRLAAARNIPVAVTPNAPISAAITLMLQNDYSQIPVMQNDRVVKGLVS
jgi:predicted transcriptional regulator